MTVLSLLACGVVIGAGIAIGLAMTALALEMGKDLWEYCRERS